VCCEHGSRKIRAFQEKAEIPVSEELDRGRCRVIEKIVKKNIHRRRWIKYDERRWLKTEIPIICVRLRQFDSARILFDRKQRRRGQGGRGSRSGLLPL